MHGVSLPHDFRSSAAKRLRRAGVAESTIMQMGGWKTAAMFRRYAVDSLRDQELAIAQLEKFGHPSTTPELEKQQNAEPTGREAIN